jgi:hypothetical protein
MTLPDPAGRLASATLVDGPTPDERGMVAFNVRVGDEIVVGIACPCGFGVREGVDSVSAAVASAVMHVVVQYAEEHKDEMLPLYREAARLRRAAGKPPILGRTRRGTAKLVGAPISNGHGVTVFVTMVGSVELKVLFFKDGGLIDSWNEEQAASEEDRDEAITLCLDYIFAHPEEATAELGLDVALLDELWR